jgi:hypothetical protein
VGFLCVCGGRAGGGGAFVLSCQNSSVFRFHL